MNDLITVNAELCDLGAEEKYDDDLPGDGRNPDKDSLSCLKGKNKLSQIKLSTNKNLKWINYISNLDRNLKMFDCSSCESLVGESVRDIKEIILSSAVWYLPEKYNIYLSTDERIDYLNKGLTDTSDEFLALENNTDLYALRLDRKFKFVKCQIK